MDKPTLMSDGNGKPTPIGSFAHLTSTAASQISTTSGFLYGVSINTATGIGTLTLYDSATGAANQIAVITSGGPEPFHLPYNLIFSNGLHVIPGGAAQDITITYR